VQEGCYERSAHPYALGTTGVRECRRRRKSY
jgi:hypothetical protein